MKKDAWVSQNKFSVALADQALLRSFITKYTFMLFTSALKNIVLSFFLVRGVLHVLVKVYLSLVVLLDDTK